jgi:hypothetical protein
MLYQARSYMEMSISYHKSSRTKKGGRASYAQSPCLDKSMTFSMQHCYRFVTGWAGGGWCSGLLGFLSQEVIREVEDVAWDMD